MKNTCSYVCKGVFLAFFILASIACDTPSVTDTPKQTEKTPDEQATPKVVDIGATAEKAIVEGAYANQEIAEVNFKQDSDITDIRGGAFKGNKITQLELPDTVERVGKDAFKGNPLQTLTLGEKLDLTKVQKDAFATSEETLTVVLKKPQPDGIDAEALARVFGKKTVQFEADPAITDATERAKLDTHVATLNTEATKIPALRTVSFYDGEALITQTHGTEGSPVAWPEPGLLPSKTGQRIENWYEAPDPSGSAFDFDTAITKDMSLYAKWGSAPTVERIAFTSPTKIYKADEVIEVTVTFTEAVAVVTTDGTPKVVLKIGIEDKEAEYTSGTGTTTLVFAYTVQAGDEDANGIEIVANQLDANGGTIKKGAIDAVLVHERVHAPTMTVDTTAPEVKTIAFTSPEKTYKATDVIQVSVDFSEVVDVDTASGTPQVVIKIGSANKNAVYQSGKSTETTLVFEYMVQGGDTDKDGIEIEADKLALNGGTIKDKAGNTATLAHTAVDADPTRKVDTTAPTVETIAFTSPEQIYKSGETIQVTVTFSEVVDVDTASGTPKVVLKIGTVDRDAVYQSGKSTPTKLVFEYTVQAGETDENGIEIETDKLALNSGTITDTAGNPATLAHTAVAADDKRTVDVRAWHVSTVAGGSTSGNADGTGTEAQFNKPYGIVVAADGTTLYVADRSNHRIRRITTGGAVTTVAGSSEGHADNLIGTLAQFSYPNGIAVAADGTLYVADTFNNRIRRITTGGAVTTVAGGDSSGHVDNPIGTLAQFSSPSGIAVAADGTLYVADTHNARIRQITDKGAVTTVAGGSTSGHADDPIGILAQFKSPNGIAVAADGTLYVADTENHRIRKITDKGAVTTVAGGDSSGHADGIGTLAQFSGPNGIAVAADGTIYVADTGNHRIRKLEFK